MIEVKSAPRTTTAPSAAALPFALDGRRIFVAGHRGMVGAAVVRRLASEHAELLVADRDALDLRARRRLRPGCAIIGQTSSSSPREGSVASPTTTPIQSISSPTISRSSSISSVGAFAAGVSKLLFLGSSCIYPKLAPQPMREEMLLTGALEPTNEWYAIAKIAGIKLIEAYRRQYGADFISLMPTNLYGPGDNYHPEHSHVPAALIRRFHEAKLANRPDSHGLGHRPAAPRVSRGR